ncbi:MAG: LptE family protein [Bacteroidetes bacterium]|nr:LptE family protein [Bacteroidota bacterium]
MKYLRTYLMILFCGAMIGSQTGCKVYSFSGASIPPDVKNFSVELFANRANNGPPALSQQFTDQLKNKFQTEANLRLVSSGGDLQFRGTITGYTINSESAIAGTTSGLNRLTVNVEVEYVNTKDEKDTWTQTFSRYAQVSSSENIVAVENQLIFEINRQIVDDIFQKALVKW